MANKALKMEHTNRIASLAIALRILGEVVDSLDPMTGTCACCNAKRHGRMIHHVEAEALNAAISKIRKSKETMEEMGTEFDQPGAWERRRARPRKERV